MSGASSSSLSLSLVDRRDQPNRPKLLLLLLLLRSSPCTLLLLGAVSSRNCRSSTRLLTEKVGMAPTRSQKNNPTR
jgi:hypothetical protein